MNNTITSYYKETVPEIGMGATMPVGSDRYPYTIVSVSDNKKIIVVQADDYTATKDSDYYSNQKYTYASNPKAEMETFKLRKNGAYVREGESMDRGSRLWIGERRAYSDPSF